MSSLGWDTEAIDSTHVYQSTHRPSYAYIRKIPILGNVIKIQRAERINLQVITALIAKFKPFQIIIEPKYLKHCQLLTEHGFRLSKSYFVPSKTIQIDLTKSESLLLSEMHQKTRYNIKSHFPYLTSHISKDILSFANFWQECALKQRGMFLSQKKEIIEIYNAFGKDAYIVLVKNGREIMSGILLICTKDIAYYMYAASTSSGKKQYAPTINVWEAMKLAKKLKRKVFDFEGIYDERFPLNSWQGFTRFKKSFGKSEVKYPGTYIKTMLPFGI
jgi:lipid II:glycine glycyltransferase (peptidoglycan interpeptide bridge formation enzyme)